MIKLSTLLLFILTYVLHACVIEDLPKAKDLFDLEVDKSKTILADGKSSVKVTSKILYPYPSKDRRRMIFTTNMGSVGRALQKSDTVDAVYLNGELIAETKLVVSRTPGLYKISAKPEFDSPVDEFELQDEIEVMNSIPSRLVLATSSHGIGANHIDEVTITATLLNSIGRPASANYRISLKYQLLRFWSQSRTIL